MAKIQPFGTPIYTTSERDALTGIPSDDFLIFNKTTSSFQQRVGGSWVEVGQGTFYTDTFDATTDWGSPSGGLYTITITAGTHGKGTSVSNVVVYETVSGDSEKVIPNEVLVDNTTGDVSFNVAETPDGRFAGKVIIQGVNSGSDFGYATVQEEGSALTQRSIINFIGSDITAVDNPGSSRTDVTISSSSVAYESSFDATTSWGAASGGLYTISITAATHGKGTNVSDIILYETVGGDSVQVLPNSAFFDSSSGDVSFTVSETPDGRFAGKVVILGKDVGSGTGYRTAQDDGSSINQRAVMNFTNGINAVDNPGSSRTDITLDTTYSPTFGGVNVSNTSTTGLAIDSGTGSEPGNQISFVDLKIDGTKHADMIVQESTSGNPLELNSGVTNDVILANGGGSVGIGATGPTSKLMVNGSEATLNGTAACIEIENTASGGNNAWYMRAGATGTFTPAAGFSIADEGGYHLIITTNGHITKPNQPSFLGILSGTANDVTGDGTVYTIGSTVPFTEIFDQAGNFNTNGTFIAPVTGRYQFNITIGYGTAGQNNLEIYLVTSNRTYTLWDCNPDNFQSVGTSGTFSVSQLADMDSGDTAIIQAVASGGSKIADFNTRTSFSGFLAN